MELVSVAALGSNRVIGDDGGLPWPPIPSDRRTYRERVSDSPVVLGRRTFESMRGDLPGTEQVVLSRSLDSVETATARLVRNVADALDVAASLGAETTYVLGGESVYRTLQPHLDRMALSRVAGDHDGDAFYPAWDRREWLRESATEYGRFTLEEWVRRR